MKKYTVIEKESILTASRTIKSYSVESENIEAAKKIAEERKIEDASEIGIFDEMETPQAYFTGGEWSFTI